MQNVELKNAYFIRANTTSNQRNVIHIMQCLRKLVLKAEIGLSKILFNKQLKLDQENYPWPGFSVNCFILTDISDH